MAETGRERLLRVLVKYDTDEESVKRTTEYAKRVDREVGGALSGSARAGKETLTVAQQLDRELGNLARRKAVDQISTDFRTATQNGAVLEGALFRVRKELEAIGATEAEIRRVAGAIVPRESSDPATTLGQRITRAGSRLYALPSVGLGPISSDQLGRIARGAGAGVDALNASASQLAIAAPIAAAGVAALVVAQQTYTDQTAVLRRGLEAALVAQNNYYEALANNTTEQTRQQIAQLQDSTALLRQQREETRNALGNQFFDPNQTLIDRLLTPTTVGRELEVFLGRSAGVGALQDRYNELDATIAANEQTVARLTAGLDANNFAANDFRDALDRLKEGFAPEPPDIVDQAINFRDFGERIFDNLVDDFVAGAKAAVARRAQEDRQSMFAVAEEVAGNRREDLRYTQMSVEQLQATADQLGVETLAAADAMDILVRSGDRTPETKKKIEEYAEAIRKNGDDIDRIITKFIPLARALEEVERAATNAIAGIDQQIALSVQATQLLGSGTVQNVDSRLNALFAEQFALSQQIPELQALAGTSEVGAQRFEAAQMRMAELNAELSTLTAIRPDVAARQYREEVEKLDAALAADVTRIETARDNRIADIRQSLADKEADIVADNGDRLTALAEQFGIDRARVEEDLQRELARIQRDRVYNERIAQGERDAYAAFQAQQQAEKQQTDAEEQADTAERRREQDYDRQLRQQAQALDKQLQQARTAAQRQIDQEYNKARIEIQLRNDAYNAQISQLQSSLYGQYSLQVQYWNAVTALAARAVEQVSRQRVSTTPITGGYTSNGQPLPGITYPSIPSGGGGSGGRNVSAVPYADGGMAYPGVLSRVNDGSGAMESAMTRSGKFMVFSEPTRVFSAQDTRRMMGGGSTAQVLRVSFDGPALAKLMDGRAVNIVAQVIA